MPAPWEIELRKKQHVILDNLKPCSECGSTEVVVWETYIRCGNGSCKNNANGKTLTESVIMWNEVDSG